MQVFFQWFTVYFIRVVYLQHGKYVNDYIYIYIFASPISHGFFAGADISVCSIIPNYLKCFESFIYKYITDKNIALV